MIMEGAGPVELRVYPSQFPDRVRERLVEAFRKREVPAQFHYESAKQTQRWLAVHHRYAPAHKDAKSGSAYRELFQSAAESLTGSERVAVIGLGCGNAWKELLFLEHLAAGKIGFEFVPCDVSVPLLVQALCEGHQKGLFSAATGRVISLDAADAGEWNALAGSRGPTVATCFGVIPNLDPEKLLTQLRALIPSGGQLLVSANLIPGKDAREGLKRILPQYANEETAQWLIAGLVDLGLEMGIDDVQFETRDTGRGYWQIAATAVLRRDQSVAIDGKQLAFGAGEELQLFESNRFREDQFGAMLRRAGWSVLQEWPLFGGEELVCRCQ